MKKEDSLLAIWRAVPISRRVLFCTAAIGCTLILAFIWVSRYIHYRQYYSHSETLPRAELLRLYESVALGDTREAVLQAWQRLDPKHLTLEDWREGILVRTPSNHWADNWILFVDLADGKVVQVFIRILESIEHKPLDAPEDKVAPTSARSRSGPPYGAFIPSGGSA